MPFITSPPLSTAAPTEISQGIVTRPIMPLSAFGEISVAANTPLIQLQWPYSVNPRLTTVLSAGSGAASASNSLMTISTGTTTGSDVLLRSNRDAKYNPGQGALVRFTGVFQASGTSGTEAVLGYGNEEDGFFFGYNGTAFGILHRFAGKLEYQTLTVSAGAGSGSGDITITLDGSATVVAVTIGDSIQDVIRKIAATSFAGWEVQANGTSAIFISHIAEAKASTFSFVDTDTTGTAATFAESITGVAPTDTWVAQASWNRDVMDGTGPGGQTLDHDTGNVFQIKFQWLGFGGISFFIEDKVSTQFQLVHVIDYANSNTLPSIQNPTLPLYVGVKNGGTTTDITVKSSSMAVFTEGGPVRQGFLNSVAATATGDLTTETCILVLKNRPIFQDVANRVDYLPVDLTFSANGAGAAKFTTLRLVHNPVIGGSTVYTDVNTVTSVVTIDTASTTRTGGNVIGTFEFGADVSNFTLSAEDLNQIMGEHQPGLVMAITVEIDGGTSDVDVGIVWRELF